MALVTGVRKAWGVGTFSVPAASGSYAFEKLELGVSGAIWDSIQGVTAWVEESVASTTVELWLPKLVPASGGEGFSAYENDDWVYFGQSFLASEYGETWTLAGVPCVQIRVKSGGTGGTMKVAATCI